MLIRKKPTPRRRMPPPPPSRYRSSFTDHALVQLAFFEADAELTTPLDEIVALAVLYRGCGVVVLSPYFDRRVLTRIGRFSCGLAFGLYLSPLTTILTITDEDKELIIRDFSRD